MLFDPNTEHVNYTITGIDALLYYVDCVNDSLLITAYSSTGVMSAVSKISGLVIIPRKNE